MADIDDWWLSCDFMVVGGGSCGPEACGVIMAGSVSFARRPSGLFLSSLMSDPAGVRGGDCTEPTGGEGIGDCAGDFPAKSADRCLPPGICPPPIVGAVPGAGEGA